MDGEVDEMGEVYEIQEDGVYEDGEGYCAEMAGWRRMWCRMKG